MVQGFVSPLDSITKIPERQKKQAIKSFSSKPFILSPMVKIEDDLETKSQRAKKNQQLETIVQEVKIDDFSIDEELLEDQQMFASEDGEEEGEEWYTLLGIIVLLTTLFGTSIVGVVANIVPAQNGFVIMA